MNNLYQDINKEISELKNKLNELNKEKESWFSKKESIHKEISSLIAEIKTIRSSSNPSKDLNNDKEARDKHNKIVKELIISIKDINARKEEVIKKNKIQGIRQDFLNL